MPGGLQQVSSDPWCKGSLYAVAAILGGSWRTWFYPETSNSSQTPKNPLGWLPMAMTWPCPGHKSLHPPSTATEPLHWSHNDILSTQSKHIITNLRLIDAICVPCLLGFCWRLPSSNGHHPRKPQALTTLALGRTFLVFFLNLMTPSLSFFPLPSHSEALGNFKVSFQLNKVICDTQFCFEYSSLLYFINCKNTHLFFCFNTL